MIVCICRGVSDRDIRNAIDEGATCLDQLERCGIGGDCRSCESTLTDMIVQCAGGDGPACVNCCAAEPERATA